MDETSRNEKFKINIFFDEKGISIIELFESDFREFLNKCLKTYQV